MTTSAADPRGSVAVVTLGCARNELDSEELAARLESGGWSLVPDPEDADVAVVNTCGFIDAAKKDSIDAVLEAAQLKESGRTRTVVAVGCLAERYGQELAAELGEADAVLGFDSYADLSDHLTTLLSGGNVPSHVPRDRRRLLPVAPSERQAARAGVALPGHGPAYAGPAPLRRRLAGGPVAPLKIGSGCDRRCAFCSIPSFRGLSVSRPADEVVAEAGWLAEQGVKEVYLVSENTTSYGKDMGDLRALDDLLPRVAAVPGIVRVRVSYLQPAEIRPTLLDVMTATPGVAPYFDVSFQHASEPLLRRMNRYGSITSFLRLLEEIRRRSPAAGIRSNVILGFPGETEDDVAILREFLEAARLDVVGVFGYSDEDGTVAAGMPDHLPEEVVAERVAGIRDLVEELTAQRAEERIGQNVEVLLEDAGTGRCGFQGPDDGSCDVLDPTDPPAQSWQIGDVVPAVVVGTDGVDLIAEPR